MFFMTWGIFGKISLNKYISDYEKAVFIFYTKKQFLGVFLLQYFWVNKMYQIFSKNLWEILQNVLLKQIHIAEENQ